MPCIPPTRKTRLKTCSATCRDTQHDRFCDGIWELWPNELKFARKPDNAREILIDLCDEQIEDLAAKLVAHAENKETHVRETVTSLKIDYTPEGKDARAYLLKCAGAVQRANDALSKYKADQRKYHRDRGYEEPRKIQEPGLTRQPRNRGGDAATFANPDLSWAHAPYPSDKVSIAKLRNEARWSEAANADLSIPEFQAFPKAKAKSEAIPPPLLEGEGRGEGRATLPSTNAKAEAFPPPLLAGEGRGEGLPLPAAEGRGVTGSPQAPVASPVRRPTPSAAAELGDDTARRAKTAKMRQTNPSLMRT